MPVFQLHLHVFAAENLKMDLDLGTEWGLRLIDSFSSKSWTFKEAFDSLVDKLKKQGLIDEAGVKYDPYEKLEIHAPVLSIFRDGNPVDFAEVEDVVEIILPETCFYVEAGGQVTDSGEISSDENNNLKIMIESVRRPAAGMIVHQGRGLSGKGRKGDLVVASVDAKRRMNIMRNHTATHLLHAQLQKVLGDHARQAGSLVAPDRLRFDFTQNYEILNND